MCKYVTNFDLYCRVNDKEAAQDYLDNSCSEMTELLKGYAGDDVVSIRWILDESDSGHIELITDCELSEENLASISNWVSGQNSDGLGEIFEQQDFAVGMDEDGEEAYASFDWDTNDYAFEKEE